MEERLRGLGYLEQPGTRGVSEERTSPTAANVVGLCIGVGAALGTQILLGRTLVPGAFGIVTVAVQVAFVASGEAVRHGHGCGRLVAIGRVRAEPTICAASSTDAP